MKFTKSCFGLVAGSSMAACVLGASFEVYTDDIFNVMENGEGLQTPMTISIQQISEDECKQKAPGFAALLQPSYASVEFVGCNSKEMSTYANYMVHADMVKVDDWARAAGGSNQPIFIGLAEAPGGGVAVVVIVRKQKVDNLVNALPDDFRFWMAGDVVFDIIVTIENDLRTPVTVQAEGVWVDGVAQLFAFGKELDRRDQVNIRISDVAAAMLSQGGWAPIAVIAK